MTGFQNVQCSLLYFCSFVITNHKETRVLSSEGQGWTSWPGFAGKGSAGSAADPGPSTNVPQRRGTAVPQKLPSRGHGGWPGKSSQPCSIQTRRHLCQWKHTMRRNTLWEVFNIDIFCYLLKNFLKLKYRVTGKVSQHYNKTSLFLLKYNL